MTPTNVFVPFVAFLEMIVLGHWKLDGSDRDIRLVKYYIFERPVKPYSYLYEKGSVVIELYVSNNMILLKVDM